MVQALEHTGTSSSTRSMWRSLGSLLVVAILSLHRRIHGGAYDWYLSLLIVFELFCKLRPLYVEIVFNIETEEQKVSVGCFVGRTALGKDYRLSGLGGRVPCVIGQYTVPK
jgi:hypothetical protein